jgi:hypothetical protein
LNRSGPAGAGVWVFCFVVVAVGVAVAVSGIVIKKPRRKGGPGSGVFYRLGVFYWAASLINLY